MYCQVVTQEDHAGMWDGGRLCAQMRKALHSANTADCIHLMLLQVHHNKGLIQVPHLEEDLERSRRVYAYGWGDYTYMCA